MVKKGQRKEGEKVIALFVYLFVLSTEVFVINVLFISECENKF